MQAVTNQPISAPGSLDELLSPLTVQEFFDRFWNSHFHYLPGSPERFRPLFSWHRLNEVFEQNRLRPPRLRLFRKGLAVDPMEYMALDGELRLQPQRFTRQLSQGATLILDDADELDPALRNLTLHLERLFRARINVNLYASWRTDNGFRVHWDAQDTLILQVTGRKRWEVHAPTRLHPLRKDVEPAPEPSGASVWNGILESGSILYLPRGWWHVAYPLNEPCLHLTVSINMPKGIDLLQWTLDRLRSKPEVRMDLPYLASSEEQCSYLNTLREQFLSAWPPNPMEEFLAFRDSKETLRPVFQLPRMAAGHPLEIDARLRLKLALSRCLDLPRGAIEDPQVSFACVGKTWKCETGLLPALRLLNSGRPYTMGELVDAVDPSLSNALLSLCREFVSNGALVFDEDSDGSLIP